MTESAQTPAPPDDETSAEPAGVGARFRRWFSKMRKKNTAFFVYLFARLFTGLIGFVKIKLLVTFLTRTQYGELGYFQKLGAAAVPIVSLSLPAAMMRMYFDHKEDDTEKQSQLMTTVWLLSLGSVALLWLAGGVLWALGIGGLVAAYLAFVASGRIFLNYFGRLSRARNDYWLFFFNRVMEAGGPVLLLGVALLLLEASGGSKPLFGFDHVGWVIVLTGVCVWSVGIVASSVYNRRGLIVRGVELLPRRQIWGLVKFAAPYSGTFFLGWLLNASDVVLIEWLVGPPMNAKTEIADYVFALGLVSVVTMVTTAALSDWPRFYYGLMRDSDNGEVAVVDRDRDIAAQTRKYLLLHAAVMAGVRVIAPLFYWLLGAKEYGAGMAYLPYLIIGNFFFLFGNLMQAGTGYAKRTYWVTFAFAVPGVVNIGLNYLVLPTYGALGASITTAISYSLFGLVSFFVGRPFYRFTEVPKMVLVVLLALVVAFVPLPF